MIKARGRTNDGRTFILLGLSAENCRRLLEGQPIRVDTQNEPPAGLDLTDGPVIAIVAAQTEAGGQSGPERANGLLRESAETLAEYVRGLDFAARRYGKECGPEEHILKAAAEVLAVMKDPFTLGQIALAARDDERFNAGRRWGAEEERRRQTTLDTPEDD